MVSRKKYWCLLHLKSTSQLLMKMNSETEENNGINGTGARNGEGVVPGRNAVGRQAASGRHQATARQTWNREVNRLVMHSYYKSDPTKRGTGKECYKHG